LTTSLLSLYCTLLSSSNSFLSSSSSFGTGFLDSSGGRGTKGSGSGRKFLDLIFQGAGGGCFAEFGSCCFVSEKKVRDGVFLVEKEEVGRRMEEIGV